MSSPRFSPWLIPETTISGSKSMSPRATRRTQSTGVPVQAYPIPPSAIFLSSTCKGVPKVIDRPTPERFLSGATVKTSPTFSRARLAASSPAASIPSSLVRMMRIYRSFSRGGSSRGQDSTIRSMDRTAMLAGKVPRQRLLREEIDVHELMPITSLALKVGGYTRDSSVTLRKPPLVVVACNLCANPGGQRGIILIEELPYTTMQERLHKH